MTESNLKKLLLVASLCLPATVLAQNQNGVAKLTEAGGTVMVDHGKGFVTTNVDAPLFENDRVITLDGSMAEITFTDGCRTKLKSNNLIVISIDPGCKAAILDATKGAVPTEAAAPAAGTAQAVTSIVAPLMVGGILIHGINTMSLE